MKPLNHWTDEQDKRQLEMWSDKHPILCGLITVVTLPFYALIILGGLVAIVAMNIWQAFPFWLKTFLQVTVGGLAIGFCFYWLLYAGLWTCGKLLVK